MVEVEADDILIEERLDLHEIGNHLHDEKGLHQSEIDHIEGQMLIDDLPRNLDLIHLVGHHIQTGQEIQVLNLEGEMIHLDLVHQVDLEIDLDPTLQTENHPDNYYFKYKKTHTAHYCNMCFFLF